MTDTQRIEFRKHMNKYFRETSKEQILADFEAANPVKVPPQYPHDGYKHTGIYRPPIKGEWYQSAGPKKPKQIRAGEEGSYGPKQCRWILEKLDDES
jgi:hypothetical protein